MDIYIYTVAADFISTVIIFILLCSIQKRYFSIIRIGITCAFVSIVDCTVTFFDLNYSELFTMGAIILCLLVLYDNKIGDAFFDSITCVTVLTVIELLIDFIIINIKSNFFEEYTNIIIMLMVMLTVCAIVTKVTGLNSRIEHVYVKYKPSFGLIFINLFFVQLIISHSWNTTQRIELTEVALVIIVVLVNILLIIKIISTTRQNEMIEYLKEMSDLREGYIKDMAQKQHEFSNHLQAIKGIIDQDSEIATVKNELTNYIDEIIEERSKEKQKFVYMGDGVFSAFLSAKREQAKKKSVDLIILVHNDKDAIPFNHKDMIELAGNLIDNAIEATEEVKGASKKVFFEVGNSQSNFFIQTINPKPALFDNYASNIMNSGFSTKNSINHGHGLTNINNIVKKHKGKLKILTDESIVIFKAEFQVGNYRLS